MGTSGTSAALGLRRHRVTHGSMQPRARPARLFPLGLDLKHRRRMLRQEERMRHSVTIRTCDRREADRCRRPFEPLSRFAPLGPRCARNSSAPAKALTATCRDVTHLRMRLLDLVEQQTARPRSPHPVPGACGGPTPKGTNYDALTNYTRRLWTRSQILCN